MALDKQNIKAYTSERIREISEADYMSLRGKTQEDKDLKYEKKTISGIDCFYENQVPSNDELNTALLYKLCKNQDKTNKHLKAIKGILIFFMVLTIIGMIAAVVLLNK